MKKFKIWLIENKKKPRPTIDINYLGQEVERPKIISWISGNGHEWIMYYNHTGHVIHFTNDIKQAYKTTDFQDAKEWTRIANELYRRKDFRPQAWHIWQPL